MKLEESVCKRLATQVISEHKRLLYINDKVYLHRQHETLAFILKLAFNPFYNAASVNVVYTKGNAKPGRDTIEAVAQKLADLEAYGSDMEATGIMVSSGMSAISTLFMSTLKTGDKILDLYSFSSQMSMGRKKSKDQYQSA